MDIKGCENAFGESGVLYQKSYDPGSNLKVQPYGQLTHVEC